MAEKIYKWADLVKINKHCVVIVNPMDDFYHVVNKKMVRKWRWW